MCVCVCVCVRAEAVCVCEQRQGCMCVCVFWALCIAATNSPLSFLGQAPSVPSLANMSTSRKMVNSTVLCVDISSSRVIRSLRVVQGGHPSRMLLSKVM